MEREERVKVESNQIKSRYMDGGRRTGLKI